MADLLLLDVNEKCIRDQVRKVTCNELDDYYKYLQCDCFDIARRKIGNKYYDIFVDDCGLLRDDPVLSAINEDGEPMLAGNLIFANSNSMGETTSLSDDDIVNIQRHIVLCEFKKECRFLLMCEY